MMNKPMSFRVIGIVSDKQEMKQVKHIMNVAITGIKIRDLPKSNMTTKHDLDRDSKLQLIYKHFDG